ncbi:MAG: hypothetical protein LH479_00020, partial [Polaromonas sp.]|nr:hypothetical protein [Polaromonas sp.]
MNNAMMTAAALTSLVGLVHSVMGERRIFCHLRLDGHVVPSRGGGLLSEFQVSILWASWHLVTLLSWVLAAVMIWLAQPAARSVSGGLLEFMLALAFALAGMLVLISNRGRHPAWIVLWTVALLAG